MSISDGDSTFYFMRKTNRHLKISNITQRFRFGSLLHRLLSREPRHSTADIDEGPIEYAEIDWRQHYMNRLRGRGIEIGPLHRPMPVHPAMEVRYVDRYPVEVLRKHYPELAGATLIAPDIIDDAQSLHTLEDRSQDFVVAAHVIEHMRNPILALQNWVRVLKPGGRLYLVVPDKRRTFDKQRDRTPLEHLILDYEQPSAPRDFEHFIEWAAKVDGKRPRKAARSAQKLAERDYSIHFHVFLPADVLRLLDWFSEHIRPVQVAEGPSSDPRSDEFHLLVQVPST